MSATLLTCLCVLAMHVFKRVLGRTGRQEIDHD